MGRTISAQSNDNVRRIRSGQPAQPIVPPGGANPVVRPFDGAGSGHPTTHAPPGAPATTTTAAPFVPYSAPGDAENFYAQHKGFYDQPGAASQYWNGVKGFYAQPQQAETDLHNWGQELHNTPGVAETRYADNARAGAYDTPGAAEDFWSKYGAEFMKPSRGEDALGGVLDSLKAPGAAETYYDQHGKDFADPGVMEQLYPQMRRQLEGPGYTENLATGYNPEASAAEQFLTGGGATGGLDAVYDRLYNQGAKRIGEEGAARGSYNSGASLRAGQELSGDLTSRHVADLQAASTAADKGKMDRFGYGLNLMTGADQAMQGRLGLLGRTAGEAQGAKNTRVLSGGKLASDAETGMLGRMHETTGASTALGDLVRKRGEFGSVASERAQGAARDRFKSGIDAAGVASRSAIDRVSAAGTLEQSGARLALDRMDGAGRLSASAGTEDNTRIAGGVAASGVSQSAKENREAGVLRNLMEVANAQAGKYASMTSEQRSAEMQLKMTEIEGLLKRGQISASQYTQMRDMYQQLLGMPLAVAGRSNPTPKPTSSRNVMPDYSNERDFIG